MGSLLQVLAVEQAIPLALWDCPLLDILTHWVQLGQFLDGNQNLPPWLLFHLRIVLDWFQPWLFGLPLKAFKHILGIQVRRNILKEPFELVVLAAVVALIRQKPFLVPIDVTTGL